MIKLENFQLSRKDMAELLLSLRGNNNKNPLDVLQETWTSSYKKENTTFTDFISTELPPIIEKLIKQEKNKAGFSINEIVSLGNQIEFTHLSSSAVQNWVKRDVKELIGSPQLGKKYTVEQAAILFIVEDLKVSLDFQSIRKILTLIFKNPANRYDDIIDPIEFYFAYASIFEKIHHTEFQHMLHQKPLNEQIEQYIKAESVACIQYFSKLNKEHEEMVTNVLIIACTTVQSSYLQSITNKHLTAALFPNGM